MLSFFTNKDLVGLDIGSGAIKLIQLKKLKRGYRLQKFGILPIDPELIIDGAVMDSTQVVSAIRELVERERIRVKRVAFSVSGHSVIVKKIDLPIMTEEELQESIKWEAEQFIPFDINDVNIDFHILKTPDFQRDSGQMSVLLVAVKKDKLTEYMNLILDAGLQPVIGDVDSFALENMCLLNYDFGESETVAIVNVGASVMNISVLKGGVFSFTRDISLGGKQYNEVLQREADLSFEQAERAKRAEVIEGVDAPHVNEIVQRLNYDLVSEMLRSFDYFKTASPNEAFDRILVSGGSARLPDLIQSITERLAIQAELVNPFARIEIPPDKFDLHWVNEMAQHAGVGVGLALRSVGDRWSE